MNRQQRRHDVRQFADDVKRIQNGTMTEKEMPAVRDRMARLEAAGIIKVPRPSLIQKVGNLLMGRKQVL